MLQKIVEVILRWYKCPLQKSPLQKIEGSGQEIFCDGFATDTSHYKGFYKIYYNFFCNELLQRTQSVAYLQ